MLLAMRWALMRIVAVMAVIFWWFSVQASVFDCGQVRD